MNDRVTILREVRRRLRRGDTTEEITRELGVHHSIIGMQRKLMSVADTGDATLIGRMASQRGSIAKLHKGLHAQGKRFDENALDLVTLISMTTGENR